MTLGFYRNQYSRFHYQRVAFLTPHLVMGGVDRVLCQYLAALQKVDGVICDVVSAEKVSEDWFLDFFKENHITLIDSVAPESEMKKPPMSNNFISRWVSKRRWRSYRKGCRDRVVNLLSSYDVVVDFGNLSFSRYISRVRAKIVGFIHGGSPYFHSHIDKNVLPLYEKVICLSDAFIKDVGREYPQYAHLFARLYNPLDVEQVRRLSNTADPDVQKPYFVAVQRLSNADKAVDTIIRAFGRFSERYPDYTLYVVGDGSDRGELEGMSNCPKIIFTGQVDNPYPLIKSAEGLILSSRKDFGEGLGMVLVEAQALGVLCISSDVKSGPAEILMGGEAGWLFEAESVESLYETLCRVVEAPEENRQKIETATKHMERFVVSNIIEQFMKMVGEEKNEMR